MFANTNSRFHVCKWTDSCLPMCLFSCPKWLRVLPFSYFWWCRRVKENSWLRRRRNTSEDEWEQSSLCGVCLRFGFLVKIYHWVRELVCFLEENDFLVILANKSCSLMMATWYLCLLSDHLLLFAALAGNLFWNTSISVHPSAVLGQ